MAESIVYITCATVKEAEDIGAGLIQQHLAACVNILPGMRSLYWWEGKVEHSEEVVLIAKTHKSLVEQLTAAVKAVHGYEVPCIISLDITGGNMDYLAWIHDQTGYNR